VHGHVAFDLREVLVDVINHMVLERPSEEIELPNSGLDDTSRTRLLVGFRAR